MIQGFGAVGTSLAYYLMKENIATVVGIADQDGFVHCADGLPVFDFINQRDERKKQLEASGADKASIFQCAKTLMCNLTADQKVKYAAVYRNDLVR
jgi:glutamate dehydrogenase/leucine dehydrogenase